MLVAKNINSQNIGFGLQSTTKAKFVSIDYGHSFSSKLTLEIGVLVGRHHSLNIPGIGLQLTPKFYPNYRFRKYNLNFVSNFHYSRFNFIDGLNNHSINHLHLVFGYGVELRITQKITLENFFGIGGNLEKRSFDQISIDEINYDTGGILSFNLSYLIK